MNKKSNRLFSVIKSQNVLLVLTLILSLLLSFFAPNFNSQATAATPPGFVGRSGTALFLDGQPYKFTGINIYNANSNGSNCWYNLATGSGLDTALSDIDAGSGVKAKVFRAWFFQHMATINGVRDWTAFDHTLSVARAHGYKVIVTLGNQWADCDGPWASYVAGYKTEQWYASDYKTLKGTAPGLPQTYRDYVASVVGRYKDDPTIVSWQLINEAEDNAKYGDSTCPATAETTLRAFADDMGLLIKSTDPNHLLSLGTIGTGQCGAVYTDYQALHASPYIDFCEFHDYGKTTEPMPGDQWNGLQMRLNQCNALNKPVFVGEVGIGTDEQVVNGNLQLRANYFDQKFNAQMTAGVVGILIWDWRNGAQGGSSTLVYNPSSSGIMGYEVGPNDPSLTVLGRYGISLPTPTPTTIVSTPTPTSIIITPTPTSILTTPTPTPVPDATPPTVIITNPTNGSTISRNSTVAISATATDNVGVGRVEFYIGSGLQCTDSSTPYTCSWKTPGKPNASYTISAKAYDRANNSSSASITVTAK